MFSQLRPPESEGKGGESLPDVLPDKPLARPATRCSGRAGGVPVWRRRAGRLRPTLPSRSDAGQVRSVPGAGSGHHAFGICRQRMEGLQPHQLWSARLLGHVLASSKRSRRRLRVVEPQCVGDGADGALHGRRTSLRPRREADQQEAVELLRLQHRHHRDEQLQPSSSPTTLHLSRKSRETYRGHYAHNLSFGQRPKAERNFPLPNSQTVEPTGVAR